MVDVAVAQRRATSQAGLGRAWLRSRAGTLLDRLGVIWVVSGAFVATEPSPYELTFILVLALAMLGGFGLHRSTLGLLLLLTCFIPFGLIAAFQVKYTPLGESLVYLAVTIFLLFTAYFVANFVADAPQRRIRLVVWAYIAAAALSALAGLMGYLDLVPGANALTLYGRAKALFKDPNVYGPFLVLPAMYLLQRVLLATGRRQLLAGALFGLLFVGVFVSFSRAAWGHLAASGVLVFVLVFIFEAQTRDRVRMILVGMAGALALLIALAGLLAIPQVGELFETRASAQSYDEGATGRFGRQAFAFDLALSHPLGLGPLEFRNTRVEEEPHNTYVNVFLSYGWGGGLAMVLLIATTIWRGTRFVVRPSPNRLLLIPLISTFGILSIEAAIIDLDHWRHFYLLAGLIWGVTAAYQRVEAEESKRLPTPV